MPHHLVIAVLLWFNQGEIVEVLILPYSPMSLEQCLMLAPRYKHDGGTLACVDEGLLRSAKETQ